MNRFWPIILSVVAGLLIGIGGIGMNTTDGAQEKLYYEICLGAGIVCFVLYGIVKYREQH